MSYPGFPGADVTDGGDMKSRKRWHLEWMWHPVSDVTSSEGCDIQRNMWHSGRCDLHRNYIVMAPD